MSNKNFNVEWTGAWPALCYGEWIIHYDGKKLELPEDIRTDDMGTYGNYSSWHFEDWQEVFEDYDDGLDEGAWIEKNNHWIKPLFESNNIPLTDENLNDLYYEISANDWRRGSCGGCI
jgi:hypothetical protein